MALIEPVDDWRADTRGVVQLVRGSRRVVEVTDYDESREFLDHILEVEVDQLRLVRKHHRRSGD